jgi:hypothetical protein
VTRPDGLPPHWCDDCSAPHTAERRLAVLRRMLPATTVDVCEAHPHLWPRDDRGRVQVRRDMAALGAVKDDARGGEWRLP